MKTFTYSNRYGTIEAKQVTEWFPVGKFSSRRFLAEHPEHPTFGIDTAEQIVLITDNRRSQITGFWYVNENGELITNANNGILLVHQSPSIVCVVKITKFEYNGPNAQEEIEHYARIDKYRAYSYS